MPKRQGRDDETTSSWADQTGVGGDPTEGGTESGDPLPSWAHQSIKKLKYGNLLWEYLVLLFAIGKLAAKDLCIIFFYIHLAGGVGDFERYGLHPDQKTDGNFQRHLDKFFWPKERRSEFHGVRIAASEKGKRVSRTLKCRAPHDVFTSEFKAPGPTTAEQIDDIVARPPE